MHYIYSLKFIMHLYVHPTAMNTKLLLALGLFVMMAASVSAVRCKAVVLLVVFFTKRMLIIGLDYSKKYWTFSLGTIYPEFRDSLSYLCSNYLSTSFMLCVCVYVSSPPPFSLSLSLTFSLTFSLYHSLSVFMSPLSVSPSLFLSLPPSLCLLLSSLLAPPFSLALSFSLTFSACLLFSIYVAWRLLSLT